MTQFDGIVILGDSCSYGADLEDPTLNFGKHLGKYYNLPVTNLARESATNFCYKWHWLDWISGVVDYQKPLVIVGVTAPHRFLVYNNVADFFQESPGRLVSEELVSKNWSNTPQGGGFIRAFPNYIDMPNAEKIKRQKDFYNNQYNDSMGEIYTIWELVLLDRLIRDIGIPIFWSNLHHYKQIEFDWVSTLTSDMLLVNNLQIIHPTLDLANSMNNKYFFGYGSHPNYLGHEHLAKILIEQIDSWTQNNNL